MDDGLISLIGAIIILFIFMGVTLLDDPSKTVDTHELRTYVIGDKEFQLNLTDDEVNLITGNNTDNISLYDDTGMLCSSILKVNEHTKYSNNISNNTDIRESVYAFEKMNYIHYHDKDYHRDFSEFEDSDGNLYDLVNYSFRPLFSLEEIYHKLY